MNACIAAAGFGGADLVAVVLTVAGFEVPPQPASTSTPVSRAIRFIAAGL